MPVERRPRDKNHQSYKQRSLEKPEESTGEPVQATEADLLKSLRQKLPMIAATTITSNGDQDEGDRIGQFAAAKDRLQGSGHDGVIPVGNRSPRIRPAREKTERKNPCASPASTDRTRKITIAMSTYDTPESSLNPFVHEIAQKPAQSEGPDALLLKRQISSG